MGGFCTCNRQPQNSDRKGRFRSLMQFEPKDTVRIVILDHHFIKIAEDISERLEEKS